MDLSRDLQKDFKEEKLRYVSSNHHGYLRQGSKKDFFYYNLDGKKIKNENTLARIKKLGIPPAWKDVWICPTPNGHIQATGVDEAGRKQYIYHEDWIKICQENKFSKMVDFGLNLPKLRNRIRYDLLNKKMDKKKILATVIWILEHTFIRIGNEEYAEVNESFGLTTLHNKHATVRGSKVIFQFKGKSNVFSTLEVNNPTIAKTIKQCMELPGYELFQFIDEDGQRHTVDSEDVNEFLKEVTNDDFTAKDFRTWGGTFLSATHLHKAGHANDEKTTKKNIVETVKKVAEHLNNTISVCRNYYIHPAIIQTYEKQILIPHFNRFAKDKSQKNGLSWNEYALIKLLEKHG